MAYRFRTDESASAALQRIAGEQISRAMKSIEDSNDIGETVHVVRKRCKKLRALLRLVRDGLGDNYFDENRTIRDAARRLARVRDADVVLTTHDSLVGRVSRVVDSGQLEHTRARLEELLPPTTADLTDVERAQMLNTFRATMVALEERVEDWVVVGDDRDSIYSGLQRTYKRARIRGRRARETRHPTNYHEWRKRVKYHWHHLHLIRELHGHSAVKQRRQAMQTLADMLGDAHDLAVYQSWLGRIPAAGNSAEVADVLRSLAFRRRSDLEKRALRMGSVLFRQKPKRFVRSLAKSGEDR
jgi:CHAD domain-containing protein